MAKNYGANLCNRSANTFGSTTGQMTQTRQDQVCNDAGGFVYSAGPMNRLKRFLVLGADTPTYYVSGKVVLDRSREAINDALSHYGTDAVDVIVDMSNSGRVPKNDTCIYALACAAAHENVAIRRHALSNLSKICRIPTHLFAFLTYVKQMRGFGRLLREAVASWYNEKDPSKLAYQMCKYRSRKVEGKGNTPWTHADVLRVSHPSPSTFEHSMMYQYATHPETVDVESFKGTALDYVYWHEYARGCVGSEMALKVIENGVSWESLPTALHNNPDVWNALLHKNLPYIALKRNLGRMTKIGVLTPENSNYIASRLTNEDELRRNRVHPLDLLSTWRVYSKGSGFMGNLDWEPDEVICDALESAFYQSFETFEPTHKRIMYAIDVSGSMSCPMTMPALTCAEGAAAMAMVGVRNEPDGILRAFSGSFVDPGIYKCDTLSTVLCKIDNMDFGRTDCSLPMLHAMNTGLIIDAFVVITDSETWCGNVHPDEALREYRERSGVSDAKLIVVAMENNPFTIADPNDPGMLDVVGFDSSTPALINEFILGNI